MSDFRPLPSKYPQLNQMEFTEHARKVLVRIIKVAFPHETVPDGPYERMADKLIAMADDATWFRIRLLQGVETLNTSAGGDFTALDDAPALAALKQVQHTDFFDYIRRTTVLEMYEDEEVWEALGYEGPSYDKGGYIDRGFDDLDWLPDPRVEEYDGEPLPDIVGLNAPAGTDTGTGRSAGTSASGTAHEAAAEAEEAGTAAAAPEIGATDPTDTSADQSAR
jgi:hypothetical protein